MTKLVLPTARGRGNRQLSSWGWLNLTNVHLHFIIGSLYLYMYICMFCLYIYIYMCVCMYILKHIYIYGGSFTIFLLKSMKLYAVVSCVFHPGRDDDPG